MERHPLKFVVEGEYDVKLFPADGETTNILNFKRGIVSALAVPLLEEEKNHNMPTIHGKCTTSYTSNAREDIDTDISLHRDLSTCDKFVPIKDHSSPLALLTGMHYPLAQLVRSSQTCNYKFDNEKKHMTSGSCTEEHLVIPFSHKGKYGFTNVGKQELTLVQVSSHNDNVFERDNNVKDLNMEIVEDKSSIQDEDAAVNLMRQLVNLPETEGERRAHLFHTLISTVRGMKTETLKAALPEAVALSRFLTYQVLAQCGTPECSSAIMHILRTFDTSDLEVDTAVFALGLMSNPSALLINDLLEMAKYKPSKPIMYALSNVVKRFYKVEKKTIPEIHSVAEFMASQLGDCTGAKDHTFMTLRVIGNMAPAVIPVSPALRTAVIQCVKEPAASQIVQQAAIQVYRQIPVPDETRDVFMQVLLDNSNPVQERIAAYLIIMKGPQPSELTQLINALSSEANQQFRSFVISHITNIQSSTEPETEDLRRKIQDALQGNEIGPTMDPIKFSRNYKIGSVQGNMIFEGVSYLPKEVMLEMTLRAFGFEIDMMEIGMTGEGFEPTIEALFGENGFFPDTALKTMYFVSENMPQAVNEILENAIPALKRNRMKRETSNNLVNEVRQNLGKLVNDLKTAQSPEAMVYLKLLGNELGYLRTNDIEEMTYSILRSLMTSPDNTIFAHYIFMDNEFFLPTVTGVPLRIALSGTFTPGFKGGLQIARDMSTATFMPFGGIEFVTQVGSHIPEYVNSGLEMHTNIFHESGMRAKVSVGRDHVKLTIPAPTNPAKLIQITNSFVAVIGSDVKMLPPVVKDKVELNKCTPAFIGMKYCSALQYADAFSHETAPYFPLTGDSKFVVELHPTGEVTEYTATVRYELLKEGDEGRQKVDVLKFILRAEGRDQYKCCFNWINQEGLRRHCMINNRSSMLQVQLLVPSISAESTVTANGSKIELEFKSDVDTKTTSLPTGDIIQQYGNEILDMQVAQTDMKVRHIFRKFVEVCILHQNLFVRDAANNYMEKYGAEMLPYMQNFRLPDIPDISLPEKLFLNTDAKAIFYFNDDRFTFVIPLPLGGKTPADLNFPPALTIPRLSIPQFGLEIPARKIPIPDFAVPDSFAVSVPVFSKVELSTLINSNLYDVEATLAAGKDVVEPPSYSARFDAKGTSPIDILSVAVEGSGMVSITESIKAHLRSSFTHKLFEASFSTEEDGVIADKFTLKSNTKIKATSQFGIYAKLQHTSMTEISTQEVQINNNFEGSFKAGPIYGTTTSVQAISVFPFRSEAKIDSEIQLDSTIFKAENQISGSLSNGEFLAKSNTKAQEDVFTHVTEISFKESRLTMKCDASAHALGLKISNQAEGSAGAGRATIRIETNGDYSDNRVYSILMSTFDDNGLIVSCNANIKLFENEVTHEARLKMNKDGLSTSGTTTLQSPLSLENTFNINYADLSANAKYSTTGKVFGTHMSHNAELEIIGLAARFSNDVRFNSQPIRFDHTMRCNFVPFDFNLDAMFNGDGDITFYRQHSGQLYSKSSLRAQPLAFVSSHECRASVTQKIDNCLSFETTYLNNIYAVLTPQEQKTSFKVKSKMNQHEFSEDIEIYNTQERVGIEVQGTILTNIMNTDSTENQDFTISGFLKYDKNTQSHIIHVPLIESLPVFMESIKELIVVVAESLQNFLNKSEVRARLEALPQEVSELLAQINLEDKVNRLKQLFSDFSQNFAITRENMDAALTSLRKAIETVFINLSSYIQTFLPTIPNGIMLPCFGKLYGEIRFQSPMYTIKTSAEFQNSTVNNMSPLFIGSFSSQGRSPTSDILNYKLDSNARIAIPKMKRVVLAETITFRHTYLGVEHQASVSLYVMVDTAPYSANLVNTAFVAVAGGMTSKVDTTYNHVVNIPFADISSNITAKQKSVVQQDGLTLNFEVESTGEGKINSHDCNHKSKFELLLKPKTVHLTFTGDTQSEILKMKQLITVESGTFKFNVQNEGRALFIKNSVLDASGVVSLYDMKIEMKAKHDTELYGADSGVVSNTANFKVCPAEVFFEIQNKANAKVNIFKSLNAKIDLQNDYLVNIRPDFQKVNAAFLARLNQYKLFSNFTADNTRNHAGVLIEVDGQTDLSFLEYPISIPELDLPFVDFHSPPIDDLNLFEKTGLKNILSSTEQTFNMDAKILYTKSTTAPIIDVMGLIQIPSMGRLNSEYSFKSAIINLNAETLLFAEDDLVFRLGATTTSVFEGLNTKLKGTTNLSLKRGIKIANSLSLENLYIKGTHDSTYSMNTVSVSTSSIIALPILNLEASQNLVANPYSKPNAQSTLKLKGDFNIPNINAIGKVEAEHTVKVERDEEYLSVESSLKSNIDSTALENYLVLGVLDNEAVVYLNTNTVRSTYKFITDAKLKHGTTKVLGIDVNQQLAAEASMGRLFVELTYSSNNGANLLSFETEGKHNAKAIIDFEPSLLKSDIEIDIKQPTSLGDLAYFEKTVVELNPSKQKITSNVKFASPVYNTNMFTEVDCSAPTLKVTFRSTATSPIEVLGYDMEGELIKKILIYPLPSHNLLLTSEVNISNPSPRFHHCNV
uniref:Apolipoprotein Bb, tandem duplicate 2 n=1 Tax=Poecilia latipinna TaxID=48699 RepID=A0A3B3V357_9TELE